MPIPQTMTYVHAEGAGGPEVLRLVTGPVPVPKPDEVLIRVLAAGVNRPDVAQRQGLPAAARRQPDPGARGRGRSGGSRRRCRMEYRRPGLRADQRRRLCRILHRTRDAMPALAGRL